MRRFPIPLNKLIFYSLQALDVDGSGSLSRADIVDLVESENSGGNEEPLTDLSSSSPSSELAAAKRSAVVEARLALSEAMAFASDSTKVLPSKHTCFNALVVVFLLENS